MTEKELIRLAAKDKRRQALYFISLLTIMVLSMGTGWLSSSLSRDAWQQQSNSWQTQYLDLYQEYTQRVGSEPSTPTPNEVATEGPAGEAGLQGIPGPVGPVGPEGLSILGAPGIQGIPGESITGPPGPIGTPGTNGTDGTDGTDGNSVTGPPGAAGATGEPGPTCPTGTTLSTTYVQTRTDPANPTTEAWRQSSLCVTN